MGLDYGSRTVGVAFTDALGITVQPAETIKRQEEHMLRSTLRRIEELMTGRDVTLIVLGRPVHMDGSEGERVEKCSIFKTKLERRLHIPVVWQDEQLTTVAADEILDESGVAAENRKKVIDQVAACLILEDYLNEHGEKHGQREQDNR